MNMAYPQLLLFPAKRTGKDLNLNGNYSATQVSKKYSLKNMQLIRSKW